METIRESRETTRMTVKMDICLVAGRRSELLMRTLESFEARVFRHFDIANCYANIDPIFGDPEEGDKTAAVIRSFFPDAHIRRPETPNFCAAVKHIWSASQSGFVLHLEDDWVVNEDLNPEQILPLFDNASIKQVSLNNFHKQWNFKKGPFHHNWRRRKFMGVRFKTGPAFPCFTTSPSFLCGDFARASSALMDQQFDPEKQFYNNLNMELQSFVKPYSNFIYGEGKPFIITDIGRDWRDERKIDKTFENGASVWKQTGKE